VKIPEVVYAMLYRGKAIIMARFDITVSEIEDNCTLPWVVELDNGKRILEIHVQTKKKAMTLADKYQTRAWTKTAGAHRFLRDAFREIS
jgi:hypothetical protein